MAIIDSVKLPDNSTYDVADNYSGYAKKVSSATTDDLASLTATGDLADSGKKLSDLVLKSDIANSLTSTATDAPLAANMGKTLEDEVRSLTNPNLLDNPFFTVNQRAQSSYSTAGYTVDRWLRDTYDNSGYEITLGAINLPSHKGNIYQLLKNDQIFKNKTYTASAKVDGTIYAFTFQAYGDGQNHAFVQTIVDGLFFNIIENWTSTLNFIGINNYNCSADHVIEAVKLEVGSISTLTNDVAPDYAEELARCQTSTADSTDTYANKGNLVTSSDLASLNLTGTTNTTGATITAGTYFYLNGQYCITTQDIFNNADFTEDTNYKVTNLTETQESAVTNIPTGLYYAVNKVWKSGNVVTLDINIINNDANYSFTDGDVLGVLPKGYAPKNVFYTTLLNRAHTAGVAIYIDTSGNIYCYESGTMTQGDFFYDVITYVN